LFQQKIYTAAWDKIKAKGYKIPHDSHAMMHAKQQKVILSGVSQAIHVLPLTL
jgi:nebulin